VDVVKIKPQIVVLSNSDEGHHDAGEAPRAQYSTACSEYTIQQDTWIKVADVFLRYFMNVLVSICISYLQYQITRAYQKYVTITQTIISSRSFSLEGLLHKEKKEM